MKTLTINLRKRDIKNIDYVLSEIASMIDDGFHSGIDCPVNWQLKHKDQAKQSFIES